MTTDAVPTPPKCRWCATSHEGRCSTVKAIEYFPDGSVKRVEFFVPADFIQPMPSDPNRWRFT